MIGAGTVLAGRYRLEQRIGSGGMGDVWRGYDQVLRRTVAVKCLRDGPADEPDFADRFRDEARTMATISHPGVVEVYDFGDDPAAGVYLVMKYIDGESLAHTLARDGRLSAEATMRLVAEAAEALHAAHEKGITHRDVKPGNLLRRPDGSTVLTDFGIARSAGATHQTSTGSLLGTAGYIAPERASGQPATARSDIYSLGVVAYRCLAGRLPFAGDSVVELALRHAHDEPPPLPADVPLPVRTVVERAMAKDPAARWPSAAALADVARRAVTAAARQRQVGVAPAPTQRQPTAAAPTRDQLLSGAGGQRGLVVVGATTALVIAVAATAALILAPRGGPTSGAAGNPSATTTTITPTTMASTGATSPTAPPSTATPTARPSVTTPTASVAAGPPAVPSGLTATPISPTAIRLQWTDNSTDEDGFTILNGVTSKDVPANTTTYDWTGLTAATHSCFKVRAYNASGASAYHPRGEMDWVCATSLPGVGPAAPTNLTATPINSSTIRLRWTDNSTGEDGFTIYNGVTSRDVGANTTTYDWDGLVPGTYMCFKVRSHYVLGVSAYHPADPDWVCATTPAA